MPKELDMGLFGESTLFWWAFPVSAVCADSRVHEAELFEIIRCLKLGCLWRHLGHLHQVAGSGLDCNSGKAG